MTTLKQIGEAHLQEGAAKAYRYYECTRDLPKALKRFGGSMRTRVEKRLEDVEYRGRHR